VKLSDNYILTGVNVIDGTGSTPQLNKAITVKDGVIVGVDDSQGVEPAPEMQVVDLDGMYVMPGLIDAHMHLCGLSDFSLLPYFRPEMAALNSVAEAQDLLRYGFTSILDISRFGIYMKRLIMAGKLAGPRIVACGMGISRTGGHCDWIRLPLSIADEINHFTYMCDSEEEIRKCCRTVLREGADQLKVWADGGGFEVTDKETDLHLSLDHLKIIAEEAKFIKGTMTTSHCCSLEGAKASVAAGMDSIIHGTRLDEEVCEQMVENGTYLIPTLYLCLNWFTDFIPEPFKDGYPSKLGAFYYRDLPDISKPVKEINKAFIRTIKDSFEIALKKGVKIAMGSDTISDLESPYGEYGILEMKAMVECGMTPLETIKSATQVGAEALGLSHMTGTIEAGKIADLLVIKGDPSRSLDVLADNKNIKYVIKDGDLAVEEGRLV
jgi:imidazolonepropionase-like amidohydrolase